MHNSLRIAAGGAIALGLITVAAVSLPGQTSPLADPETTLSPAADLDQSRTSLKDCSERNVQPLLPTLPKAAVEATEGDYLSFKDGALPVAPSPGLPPNPDAFKALLGYYGPNYNLEAIDGTVTVLKGTTYAQPGDTWHVTGMVRNQACYPVRISTITAHLRDRDGASLGYAEARPLVEELRPGEPSPFEIVGAQEERDVASVDWQVQYEEAHDGPRSFELNVFEAGAVMNGDRYSLYGSVRNIGSDTALKAHIVAAWLDREGRVLFMTSPKIRPVSDPSQLRDATDLLPGDIEDFYYGTDDPSLIPMLSNAMVALWGVSE